MPHDPRDIATELETWFARHARPLPWRTNRTPYRVWVSEIMLQQTRVDTVLRYYEPFLERFPDAHALARATEAEVLKAWQGLGYYQRARRMHHAAKLVVDQRGGELPGTVDELRTLPGFGAYTAAAVAALAFGRPQIAVDANVRRVGARWLGQDMPDDGAIADALGAVVRVAETPAAVVEALIEVGALVCTPRDPACPSCPLRSGCLARATGRPEAFPKATSRPAPREVHRTACLAVDAEGVWLRQRPSEGLLGGLWGVPQLDGEATGTPLGRIRHAYTHLRLVLDVILVTSGSADLLSPGSEHVAWARLPALPVSTVDLKIFALAGDSGQLPPEAVDGLRGTMRP